MLDRIVLGLEVVEKTTLSQPGARSINNWPTTAQYGQCKIKISPSVGCVAISKEKNKRKERKKVAMKKVGEVTKITKHSKRKTTIDQQTVNAILW